MRLYTTQHPFDCGIDLHAHAMDVCILNQAGETLRHRNMTTTPASFLTVLAPQRDGIVVAVACRFPWSWLADLGAEEGVPFVLGHALSMKAIHGSQAKNDQSDSRKIAVLLRGGMLPQAYGYPAAMRAPRDLRRRRRLLAHKRGALLAPVQHTKSPYHLLAIGKKLASQANRAGGAQRFADPAVHKRIAVALALIGYQDELLRDGELPILTTAQPHDATTLYLLPTVPGLGTMLSLGLRYAIPPIDRVSQGQAFASSCRLVKWVKEADGTRAGTSGSQSGQAHLKGAFSEAAVFFLRDHPAGQTCLTRLEKQHDQGQALPLFAPT